jgi:5-methylcytosine-specific restriction endonuclease McrA
MGIGRGVFRKKLKAVLLSRHETDDLERLVRDELEWRCVYCGVSSDLIDLQLDHLWPERIGGCLVIGNVAPSCPTCNSTRGDTPWRVFLKTSERVTQMRSANEVEQQIKALTDYMNRHGQSQQPNLESLLTADELQLLADFDLLLSALSDGSLAKVGHVKKSAIDFDEPVKMFDELVIVAQRHRRQKH